MLKTKLKKQKVWRDMLFDILHANHLLIKTVRSWHITTNSHHRFRKHKNLVENRDEIRPEEIWVSDITYIGNRNIYLSLVTNACSKRIMGYDQSCSLDTQGSLNALKMANSSRLYREEPLIHYSVAYNIARARIRNY